VFALTRKPGFFLKIGFGLTRIEDLPRKVQKDCVFCPKFTACDEVAVIMLLPAAPFTPETENLMVHVNGKMPQTVPLVSRTR
jgi:hypothetical protein